MKTFQKYSLTGPNLHGQSLLQDFQKPGLMRGVQKQSFFLPSGMAMLLHGYFTYILGFSTEILKKTNLMLILFLQLQNILGSISSFELLISGQKGMPI